MEWQLRRACSSVCAAALPRSWKMLLRMRYLVPVVFTCTLLDGVKNRGFFHYPPDFQKIVKKSAISFIIQVTNRQLGYLKAPEHHHYTR